MLPELCLRPSTQCLRPSTALRAAGNKTENAFSPLPARTKAYNADMTAGLPLLYMTASSRLQVYRKFLPPCWSPDNKHYWARLWPDNSAVALHAYSRHYMRAAWKHWQVLKLHGCAHRCPAAAAVSQTTYCSHLQ
jgi:hypothetical protein